MARGNNSRVGERRQKIALYRPIQTDSFHGGGAKRNNYIKYASPWCQIMDERTIEIFTDDQRKTELTVKVQMRYNKNRVIAGEDLAVFKGRTWRLLSPKEKGQNYADYTNLLFKEVQGDFVLSNFPDGIIYNEDGTDGWYRDDFSGYFYTATGVN